MYLTSRSAPTLDADPTVADPQVADLTDADAKVGDATGSEPSPVPSRPARAGATPSVVVLLGLTSMFTDVSSEMVASVLPLYLATSLGFTPLQFGAADGLLQAGAALLALALALAADRRRRHKELATAGYAASAACRFGLLAGAGAGLPTLGFLYLDRVGKGVRTAPRDAMISLSAQRGRLGRAFGVHRAFDTAGAVAGPVVASLILARSMGSFPPVFAASACVATVGVAIIALLVRNPVAAVGVSAPARSPARRMAVLVRTPGVRPLLGLAAVLGALSPGDGLAFLAFQRSTSLPSVWFPWLFVGTASVFLVLAVPFGRLSDRIGPPVVVAGGLGCLAGAFVALAVGVDGVAGFASVVVPYGAYYAATDAVLATWMSRLVPAGRRAAGLALLFATLGAAHLVGAVSFGAFWERAGQRSAALAFAAGQAALAAVLLWGVRRGRRRAAP
jgi:MFS family permease